MHAITNFFPLPSQSDIPIDFIAISEHILKYDGNIYIEMLGKSMLSILQETIENRQLDIYALSVVLIAIYDKKYFPASNDPISEEDIERINHSMNHTFSLLNKDQMVCILEWLVILENQLDTDLYESELLEIRRAKAFWQKKMRTGPVIPPQERKRGRNRKTGQDRNRKNGTSDQPELDPQAD